MKSVVCFDIGIKNLAYCHLALLENSKYEIIGWENVNLLTQDKPQAENKKLCFGCKSKATYEGGSCSRHCVKPPLVDLSGNKLTKIPSGLVLRSILLQKEHILKKTITKNDLLTSIKKYYTLPLEVVKAPKAQNVDLSYLHDCMRSLVEKHADVWKTASEIRLENQPAFKNPHMKSVQMLLFATIRDMLHPSPPPIKLVHAGIKVQGKAKGDEGYKDRKKGSEERVSITMKSGKVLDPKSLYSKYEAVSKKNDLADALSMCLDALCV